MTFAHVHLVLNHVPVIGVGLVAAAKRRGSTCHTHGIRSFGARDRGGIPHRRTGRENHQRTSWHSSRGRFGPRGRSCGSFGRDGIGRGGCDGATDHVPPSLAADAGGNLYVGAGMAFGCFNGLDRESRWQNPPHRECWRHRRTCCRRARGLHLPLAAGQNLQKVVSLQVRWAVLPRFQRRMSP